MFKFSHIKVTSVAGTRLKPHQSEALWVVYSISNDYVFCLLLISTEKCLPIVDNVISLVHHTIRPTPVCCVWMTHQPLKAGAHTTAIISLILPLIAPRHNQHRASLFRVPIFPHCCLSFSLLIVCKVKRYFHLVLLSLRLMIITMSIWWWMSKTISETSDGRARVMEQCWVNLCFGHGQDRTKRQRKESEKRWRGDFCAEITLGAFFRLLGWVMCHIGNLGIFGVLVRICNIELCMWGSWAGDFASFDPGGEGH